MARSHPELAVQQDQLCSELRVFRGLRVARRLQERARRSTPRTTQDQEGDRVIAGDTPAELDARPGARPEAVEGRRFAGRFDFRLLGHFGTEPEHHLPEGHVHDRVWLPGTSAATVPTSPAGFFAAPGFSGRQGLPGSPGDPRPLLCLGQPEHYQGQASALHDALPRVDR